jgi:hypothetical protein
VTNTNIEKTKTDTEAYLDLVAQLIGNWTPAPLGIPTWNWDDGGAPYPPPRTYPGDLSAVGNERLTVLICERTKMTPEHWASLDEAARIPWMEQAVGGSLSNQPQDLGRLQVNLEKKTITLDGTKHEVDSDLALRWIKVLAEHPEQWISSTDLKAYDGNLDGARPHKFKNHLPQPVLALVESDRRKGSRLQWRIKPPTSP